MKNRKIENRKRKYLTLKIIKTTKINNTTTFTASSDFHHNSSEIVNMSNRHSFPHPSSAKPVLFPLGGGGQRGNNANNSNKEQQGRAKVNSNQENKKNQSNNNSFVSTASNTQQLIKNNQAINKQKQMIKTMSQASINQNQKNPTSHNKVSLHQDERMDFESMRNKRRQEDSLSDISNAGKKKHVLAQEEEEDQDIYGDDEESQCALQGHQDESHSHLHHQSHQNEGIISQEEEETNQERLRAVKLLIRNKVVPQYAAPRALFNEITRCKKIDQSKIKFANLKGCILTIATDDKETHNELTSE